MARDLEHEDHLRALKNQQAALGAFRANPAYKLLEERIQQDKHILTERVATHHRATTDELRVTQGEIKAYNHVLVILEREVARVNRLIVEAEVS